MENQMSEDELFAEWEAQFADEYEDPDMMVRIPEMGLKEVTDEILKLSKELGALGELKAVKTHRGLELHQLWVRLKTRQHDLMNEWPDDPEVPQAPA